MSGCILFTRTYEKHCEEMRASYDPLLETTRVTKRKHSCLEYLKVAIFCKAYKGSFVIFKGLKF